MCVCVYAVVFLHAPYVTLFMRFCSVPHFVVSLFAFILLSINKKKRSRIAVIDMKQCNFYLCSTRANERFVFAVQLSRDAQSPNPYNPNAYFIYQSGIHSFSFDGLSLSLILSAISSLVLALPLNKLAFPCICREKKQQFNRTEREIPKKTHTNTYSLSQQINWK